MDYDLSRLSPRSFEQLVQALAAAVIGPGIVIFGDGPDGGREATFEGRVPFPDRDAPWDGYGVVQANYRQRAAGGGDDATWALTELKKDLAKFSDAKRALRRPDYYLFATNVVLSPVAKSGGKDKVTALLDGHCRKHGLKGFQIWDYDQICTLLDGQPAVRTAYTAWITPGDVLAAVLERIPGKRADFRSVMRAFIQKDLRADQYVNLGQAGHLEADRTPLARVFVDLPVSGYGLLQQRPTRPARAFYESPFDQDEKTTDVIQAGAMADLLAVASQRLDPKSFPTGWEERPLVGNPISPPGRLVLIGGPGQGKSTLSQFVCQVHRAALLGLEPDAHSPPEVADACELIRAQCACESLALPSVPRFPLRVELNHFAKALADKTAPSLFGYLRARIAARAERDIDWEDLHAWLGAYPWLLVLDGLDEVPASSNRTQVLDSIEDFLVDAHEANADLLLVATSRPQGYNDDFSPRYYRQRQLLPLDVDRALHYAERLANERWGADPDRVARVLTRLRTAGAKPATGRLMHSPLQVAIMTLLVDGAGAPPRERWRLFSEYYRVIYDRERQRDIPAALLLSDYQADIDTIHQRVALRLQMESERVGGTDASLDAADFAALVDQRLAEEEHPEAERAALTRAITQAALHRLVFLVAPSDGAVGFEVRSLQEFMAAQCLTNGPDAQVAERLRAIAPAAHWRNCFLFAAGRCFHERQHLRDTVYTLCCELNEGECVPEGGDLERATLVGSRLALQILEDGAVARQPAQIKLYARLAMRLMDIPPAEEQLRVAGQYQTGLKDVYREEIHGRLTSAVAASRLGTWRVLLQLVGQGQDWARSVAEGQWPKDTDDAFVIFQAAEDLKGGDWLAARWQETVPRLLPGATQRMFFAALSSDWWAATPDWQHDVSSSLFAGRVFLPVRMEGVPEGLWISLVSVFGSRRDGSLVPSEARKEWHWLVEALDFEKEPSKEKLAVIISQLGQADLDICRQSYDYISSGLSWPLASCVTAIVEGTNQATLVAAAREGRLGDSSDWQEAERRWEECGATTSDFRYQPADGLPFDCSVGSVGFPLTGYRFSWAERVVVAHLESLVSLWRKAATGGSACLANAILVTLGLVGEFGGGWHDLSPADLRRVVVGATKRWVNLNCLSALPDACWDEVEGLEALDLLGNVPQRSNVRQERLEHVGRRLECLAAQHPTRGGILRLLAAVCRNGYRPSHRDLHPDADAYADPRHQAAALLVRLAQGDWDEADADRLGQRLADLQGQEPEAVDSALDILRHQDATGRPTECLLTALYAALPATAWEARRDVMTAMQSQQRRRLSAPIP